MDDRKLVENWHQKIIELCERRLGRQLTAGEKEFITSRDGLIALEMIEDTVLASNGNELVSYLNSEIH